MPVSSRGDIEEDELPLAMDIAEAPRPHRSSKLSSAGTASSLLLMGRNIGTTIDWK